MIYLRRRQKYASNAIQTRNAASVGANGAKVGRGPPPGGFGKPGKNLPAWEGRAGRLMPVLPAPTFPLRSGLLSLHAHTSQSRVGVVGGVR
ncbi:unnamed protein product [Mesocestoides corti]|uniref:Uncharacterized protein n=1 Tax=Mesocestoides corti TaxID=53468 RepID=A0A0R3U8A8_MESCO|nr:unnamed protein product [Mesocestoides corti]